MLTCLSRSLNTPPSIAPLISGLLLTQWPWPSIFWFLSIASLAVLVILVIFLPETCHNVGNDGDFGIPIFSRPLSLALCPGLCNKIRRESVAKQQVSTKSTSPLSVLKLLKDRSNLFAVCCFSIYYTIYSCLQASLSTIFVETYDVSGLIAGVIYIPFGMACAISAFLSGTVCLLYLFALWVCIK